MGLEGRQHLDWSRRDPPAPLNPSPAGEGLEPVTYTTRTAARPRRPSSSSVAAQTSASARSGERPGP